MTGRIEQAFARCRAENRAALVGYLTAFDPDREGSIDRILAACKAGIDILELGVPFSDPAADGPVVQGAMVRALAAGATLLGSLDIAREVRARTDVPIVLFTYANPLLCLGTELASRLRDAGVDGTLVLDVPPEATNDFRRPLAEAGLDWVALVAPTTPETRMARIASASSGFVYLVSLKGVTGASLPPNRIGLADLVAKIRTHTDLPIGVGFGIKTPEDAAAVAQVADGVVVGSALVVAGEESPAALGVLVAQLRRVMGRR